MTGLWSQKSQLEAGLCCVNYRLDVTSKLMQRILARTCLNKQGFNFRFIK